MTFDDYLEQVTVGIIPEAPMVPYVDGGLKGTQTFLLRTIGMDKFDRPDLEMINVPAMFVHAAGKILNHWAHYSIEEEEIKADETLIIDHGMPVLVRIVETDHLNVLRLVAEAVQFQCCACGEDGTCDCQDGICTCQDGEEPSPTIH